MSVSTAVHQAERYSIVLIPAGEKGPNTKDWQHSRATPEEYDHHIRRGGNAGFLLGKRGGIVDLEIDGPEGEESLRKLFGGEPPEAPSWRSKRGRHRLYLYDDRFASLGAKFTHDDYPDLEFRIGGGDKGAQSVCPPSKVDGVTREWIDECEPAALPDAVIEKIVELGKSRPRPVVHDSPFGNAQQDKLAKLLQWADRFGVPLSEQQTTNDKGTIVIPFDGCPLRGHDDGGSTVFINDDGSHVFHCHHTKCQGKTFADVEAKYGPFYPPKIIVGPDLFRVAAEAINALRRADVYNRGGVLVELMSEAPMPKLCQADNGAPRLRPVPPPSLMLLLSEHARWQAKIQTQNGVKIKRVDPPSKIVNAIVASSHLPGIPTICGVVSCPVLRADGSIASKPGYDKLTGLSLDIDGDWPPVPMSVDEAVERLADIFCDFPFADPAHKSACIAGPVTMAARYAFAGPAPAIAIDGNAPRLGKGLATDAFTMIAEGRKASRMSFSEDDAEMRKCITSCALAGSSYVLFDNVKGKFGGKSLEGAMTAGRWSDRLLGGNQMIDLPFNPVWLMTSNNCSISPDMVGRLLMCKLHTADENPGARSNFRHPDLLAYIKQHRRQLAMAALSIPYQYMRAGRPKQAINAWGGFDGWNDLVRASLVWAGLPDPDTRTQVAEESDEESSTLRQLIDAWPKGLWSVANIIKAIHPGNYSDSDPYPALREIIAELPGNDKARALGQILRDSRGRVLNGKRFVREGGKNGRKWAVETI
ncbi:MAG TPA: bifunctional DNA primase/polymerase [Pirellulales bacterium]|nr:bifunctional DNA primase/polymerase [Pirellulales bacterium]